MGFMLWAEVEVVAVMHSLTLTTVKSRAATNNYINN